MVLDSKNTCDEKGGGLFLLDELFQTRELFSRPLTIPQRNFVVN